MDLAVQDASIRCSVGAAAEEPNRWLLAGRGARFRPAGERLRRDLGFITFCGIMIAEGSCTH